MRVPASSEPVQHELCQPCWQEEEGGEDAPHAEVVAGLRPAPHRRGCVSSLPDHFLQNCISAKSILLQKGIGKV